MPTKCHRETPPTPTADAGQGSPPATSGLRALVLSWMAPPRHAPSPAGYPRWVDGRMTPIQRGRHGRGCAPTEDPTNRLRRHKPESQTAGGTAQDRMRKARKGAGTAAHAPQRRRHRPRVSATKCRRRAHGATSYRHTEYERRGRAAGPARAPPLAMREQTHRRALAHGGAATPSTWPLPTAPPNQNATAARG